MNRANRIIYTVLTTLSFERVCQYGFKGILINTMERFPCDLEERKMWYHIFCALIPLSSVVFSYIADYIQYFMLIYTLFGIYMTGFVFAFSSVYLDNFLMMKIALFFAGAGCGGTAMTLASFGRGVTRNATFFYKMGYFANFGAFWGMLYFIQLSKNDHYLLIYSNLMLACFIMMLVYTSGVKLFREQLAIYKKSQQTVNVENTENTENIENVENNSEESEAQESSGVSIVKKIDTSEDLSTHNEQIQNVKTQEDLPIEEQKMSKSEENSSLENEQNEEIKSFHENNPPSELTIQISSEEKFSNDENNNENYDRNNNENYDRNQEVVCYEKILQNKIEDEQSPTIQIKTNEQSTPIDSQNIVEDPTAKNNFGLIILFLLPLIPYFILRDQYLSTWRTQAKNLEPTRFLDDKDMPLFYSIFIFVLLPFLTDVNLKITYKLIVGYAFGVLSYFICYFIEIYGGKVTLQLIPYFFLSVAEIFCYTVAHEYAYLVAPPKKQFFTISILRLCSFGGNLLVALKSHLNWRKPLDQTFFLWFSAAGIGFIFQIIFVFTIDKKLKKNRKK